MYGDVGVKGCDVQGCFHNRVSKVAERFVSLNDNLLSMVFSAIFLIFIVDGFIADARLLFFFFFAAVVLFFLFFALVFKCFDFFEYIGRVFEQVGDGHAFVFYG